MYFRTIKKFPAAGPAEYEGESSIAEQYNKWIEVDLEAVKHNVKQVQSLLDDGVRLIAVVKNGAYGHGAAEFARILFNQGVDFLAVSYLEEALALRDAGLRASIMLFTPLIREEEYKAAIRNNITITVASGEDWNKVRYVSARLRTKATVHLKVETGLHRFGLNQEELMQIAGSFNSEEDYLYIEGIYTHMAQGANEAFTFKQFHLFQEAVEALEAAGLVIPVKHCANSTVCLKYPQLRLDAVRIGTLLTGQYPVGSMPRSLTLKDPFKYKCRIIAVKTRPKGTYLGYQSTYKLKRDAQIAVLPVGYSDGLALEIANPPSGFMDMLRMAAKTVLRYLNYSKLDLSVKIAGQSYPIRGKVFMQMALVEVPLQKFVQVGEEVELPVRKTLTAGQVVRLYTIKGEAGKKLDNDGGITYLTEGE